MTATVSGRVYLTRYDDLNGWAGATVTIGTQTAVTNAQGMFAIQAVPDGPHMVVFEHDTGIAGQIVRVEIDVGANDVQLNLESDGYISVTANNKVESSVSVAVVENVLELHLIGSAANATGDDRTDLFGNAADNRLTGGNGLSGGDGIDTAVFAGARQDFQLYFSKYGLGVIQQVGGSEDAAFYPDIERLEFAGATFAIARAQQNLTANFDDPRFDDVLFQQTSTGALGIRHMRETGAGDFNAITAVGARPSWHVVGSGDTDGNGYADIFVQDSLDSSVFTINLHRNQTILPATTALDSDWEARAVGDITGDAAWDVVVQNKTNGTTYFADMAQGSFTAWGMVSAGLTPDWRVVGTGDLNADGYADVAFQNLNAPGAPIYFANMAQGSFANWGVVSAALTADWRAVGIGDLNGDGFAEVIVRNQSNGDVYFADLSGGPVHWGVVTTTVTPDWQVKAVADVDNDGYRDVVFQEGATGTAYYAHMVAGAFAGWGVVSTDTGPDWQVVF